MAAEPAHSSPAVLFARQPICDARQKVVGYELLFRGERGLDGSVLDDRAATAQVLLSAFGDVGLDATVGTARAYLNVSAEFLLEADPLPFGPERVVLELLEHSDPTPALLARLDALRAEGYTIALDDFALTFELVALAQRADIIKVDVRAGGVAEAVRQAELLRRFGATLLAEKVEDDAEQAACAAAGFELFQGWWFCRPEIVEGLSLSSVQLGCLSS